MATHSNLLNFYLIFVLIYFISIESIYISNKMTTPKEDTNLGVQYVQFIANLGVVLYHRLLVKSPIVEIKLKLKKRLNILLF